ncbi:SMP-30/gluconolactonase/LRE family protein [Sphingomonas sp. LHG3406-1]|uniref:SMP-30/gluconolactonase/LRE family protein n=1 Tax=Sphingomonas sp. LHG3406-1 TaxID=2804617 RepID=UPI002605D2AD|nr:SMP-30/gluconolactonase/LRE family protein [Sphingomonas sp. LHG3406-1]
MTGEPASIWSLGAELGEGPTWIDDRLWFVDIKKKQIHRFDPDSGEKRSWSAPEQVGFIVPRARGGFIVGLQSGLFAFDPGSGGFDQIVAVDRDKPNNRLNDAVVDGEGRLWFGTMHDGERDRTGAFYCYAEGRLRHTGIDDIAITNGPAISPDGRSLYWVDTLGGRLCAATIGADGGLMDSRLLVSFTPEEGYPDGPTGDAEGGVWIGLYAGWQARRYSPAGELLQTIAFPVANITKVAFGGRDRRTLFATTARQLLSAEQIAGQPQAGDLFALEIGIKGQPCTAVRD